MKKFLSFILGVGLLFNNNIIFATKGDPLTDKDVQLIRENFKALKNRYQNSNRPHFWTRGKANTSVFSDDYREINVYNIPHLLSVSNDEIHFVRATAKLLIEQRKAAREAHAAAMHGGQIVLEIYAKTFKKIIEQELSKEESFRSIQAIADTLGVSFEDAKNSCEICSSAMALGNIMDLLGGVTYTAGLVMVLGAEGVLAFIPGLGLCALAGAALGIGAISTETLLSEQRAQNCAMVLKTFSDLLSLEPNRVLKSNVFVSAIDKREFSKWFFLNRWRENHEAWCDFILINGLDCAPLAGDYVSDDNRRVLPYFLDIFHKIRNTNDSSLDLESIEKYIKGNPPIERPMLSAPAPLENSESLSSSSSSPETVTPSKVEEIV
jgi:hypothetical protein